MPGLRVRCVRLLRRSKNAVWVEKEFISLFRCCNQVRREAYLPLGQRESSPHCCTGKRRGRESWCSGTKPGGTGETSTVAGGGGSLVKRQKRREGRVGLLFVSHDTKRKRPCEEAWDLRVKERTKFRSHRAQGLFMNFCIFFNASLNLKRLFRFQSSLLFVSFVFYAPRHLCSLPSSYVKRRRQSSMHCLSSSKSIRHLCKHGRRWSTNTTRQETFLEDKQGENAWLVTFYGDILVESCRTPEHRRSTVCKQSSQG